MRNLVFIDIDRCEAIPEMQEPRRRIIAAIFIVCGVIFMLWYNSTFNIGIKQFFYNATCNPGTLGTYSQSYEDQAIYEHYFKNKCNGTFIEVGALDGILYSNTLMYERDLGWTGALIEAEPNNIAKLRKNRKKAMIFDCAVCPAGVKSAVFAGAGAVGGLKDHMSEKHSRGWKIEQQHSITVQCKTLQQIIAETKMSHVDLLSVDLEGAEYTALSSLDWTVPVRIVLVEVGHSPESDKKIVDYMISNGFVKADWDLKSYCKPGHDCTSNILFENRKYPLL